VSLLHSSRMAGELTKEAGLGAALGKGLLKGVGFGTRMVGKGVRKFPMASLAAAGGASAAAGPMMEGISRSQKALELSRRGYRGVKPVVPKFNPF